MKTKLLVLAFVLMTIASHAQIGQWLLNNNANDASSNAINGTLVGSPTFSTTAQEGDYSLVLNGTSQYVNLGNPSQFPSGSSARSICGWAMTNSVTGSRIFFSYGTAGSGQAMLIGLNGTTLVGGGFTDNINVTNYWATGVWHHICLTYNGTTAKVYADGVLMSSVAKTWNLVLAGAFIGKSVNNTGFWSGSIDDVRIYNTELTSTQVQTLASMRPTAPANLTTVVASSNTVNLTWTDASSNETGFQIERSLTSGSGFSLVTTAAANATSYSDATLTAGTTYYYRIRSINGTYYSSYSSESSVSIPAIPATPSALVASSTNTTSITLNWTDASSNETSFLIERSLTTGTGFTQIGTVAANVTTYSDATLSAGTQYFYRIRAANNNVYSSYSSEANATTLSVPNAPTGLTATGDTPSSINLTWTDASTNETGFQIERSLTTGSGYTLLTTTAANVTSYTDAGLTSGTTYYYRMRAMNGASTFSAYTSEVSSMPFVVPASPTGLAASATSSTITLNWTDASTNEDGFQLERSTTSGSGFSLLASLAANTITYSDATATSGVTYYYRVRSFRGGYFSGYTSEVSAVIGSLPTVPSSLTITTVTSTSVSLSWTDASSNETGFLIERTLTSDTDFSQIGTVGANVVTFTDTGLTPDKIYYYRVRAYNASGNSDYTDGISVNTLPNPPLAPTGLSATPTSDNSATMQWVDQSDNESNFQIERSTTSGSGFVQIGTTSSNVQTYADQGLTPSTTYYYRVRAVNEGGNSSYTNETAILTMMAPPTNVKTEVTSSSAINLTWKDNSNDETGFQIERSTTPGSGFTILTTVGAGYASFTNSSLPAGTYYYYRIKAINGSNSSPYSEQVGAATMMTLPASPTMLRVESMTSGYVNLSWTDASTNETGFEIQRSTTSGSGYSLIGTLEMNSISYSDTDITPGSTYYYRVRALNPGGFSNYSAEVTVVLSLGGATELCSNIFCTTDGVGIGTNVVPTGYKMAVKGKVMMEGAKIDLQTKWPDYVFEKGYPIKDIDELKKYIDEHGHLPDVPSSETVEKEGVDVEQINVLLLQKIEEMSLYLIQMEERINKLEVENTSLKKKKS